MTEALALKQESIVFSLKLLLEGEAGSVSRWDLHGNLTLFGKSGFKLRLSLYNYFFHLIPIMSCLCSSRSEPFSTIISHAQLDIARAALPSFAQSFAHAVARLAADCINATISTFAKIIVLFVSFYFPLPTIQSTLILTNFV